MKMGKHSLAHLGVAVLFATGAFACAKQTKPDPEAPAAVVTDADAKKTHDSDSGNAGGLETVHFPFNSNAIDGAGKEVLKKDAAILKQDPQLRVQVEGHCDQRGGSQYNLALGERRAHAVKKYLEAMGVAGNRISTISQGKEHLLDPADTEEAYAKNRRANFVLTE
jgi:peptidoglycan-associated lipoprotein